MFHHLMCSHRIAQDSGSHEVQGVPCAEELGSILHRTLPISTNSVRCSPHFSRPHFIDQVEFRLRRAAKAGKTTALDDIMDTILAGLRTEAHCALLGT
jgi:hypothetical protein